MAALADASAQDDETEIIAAGLRKQLADCERKLKQYRTLLDEGADAATVAGWMREVETERIGVQAKLRSVTGQQAMSPEEITPSPRHWETSSKSSTTPTRWTR